MGVPKFFRYISLRYPCLSEILKEYQIPQFDNLYLDMNGIIHTCSHLNDDEIQIKPSEDDIFKAIFHYIEVLFHMIQPQKLFFIAVDGVAPRAKINQQRSRRFRSAKLLELAIAKMKEKGVEISRDQIFNSNCITPGTEFMATLSDKLKTFIMHKIQTESLWQKCKVLYSGPEVPGEGEHKIMDYIRYMRTNPSEYDPNGSHCLYGLDGDLIMLGLCTHEIHFSLLREEVKFGKKQTQLSTPEETKFCLLHLSLLREYINFEFSCLKGKLPFPYDPEKIIDDWVLMGFLIGNDFIPHLPNLHITNGALPALYHAYIEVLPTLGGYINEAGTLRLDRFEKFMERLSHLDMEQFKELSTDLKCFERKTGRRITQDTKHFSTSAEEYAKDLLEGLLELPHDTLGATSDKDDSLDDDWDIDIYGMDFVQHKQNYYMNKLEYEEVDAAVLRSQAEGYVRAIQWNLHYYYNGCCSWTWYYPHHYAPYISDIKDFKDLKLEFELGEPFLPLEQLLAVLPVYNKSLLPEAFQNLLDEESPILDYYPTECKTDLNGKRDEWEAVVLLPFIDGKRLQDAMKPLYSKLKPEEVKRNKHGPMCLYVYLKLLTPDPKEEIALVGGNRVMCAKMMREDIFVPREKLIKGLHPEAKPEVHYPGFPTFQYIEYTVSLRQDKTKVFPQQFQKETVILDILPRETPNLMDLALDILGKKVYVSWPYLMAAQVVAVSDSEKKINIINPLKDVCEKNIQEEEMKGFLLSQWKFQKKHIAEQYKNSLGIDIGETSILIHARPSIGKKYTIGPHRKLNFETQWDDIWQTYAYQMVVRNITVHVLNVPMYKTVDEIFKRKNVCFMLGHPHYGAMGEVIEVEDNGKSTRLKVLMEVSPGPSLDALRQIEVLRKSQYMYGTIAAQRLGINSLVLSRITGTILVTQNSSNQEVIKHNVGLNLKFTKKNEEVPGYTKKENGHWLYSTKAVELVRNYMVKCPDFFEKLVKNATVDIFHEDELFNKESGELEMVLDWLKEQQYQSVKSRPCGADVLDEDMVQLVEKELDAYCKKQDEISKFVLMQVKPRLLFTPALHLRHTRPDSAAKTYMLDRICCIRENFTVPLGSKGIIVGIYNADVTADTMNDIIFDKPFTGGLTLNGSSKNRAYRLSAADFINISYGERIQQTRTGVTNVTPDSLESWKKTSNYKQQSRTNATSAFATFNTENSPSQPATITPSNAQVPKKTQKANVRSEFQALWNDLHKIQQKTAANQEKVVSNPTGAKTKQTSTSIGESSPQDPSAFLKAMLRISDGGAQNKAKVTSPATTSKVSPRTPPQQEKSDAPPLVQQLFDQARKNEEKKDEKSSIWHCSQLLNYHQLSGTGMPRYRYLTNLQTNLVRAQILLPDARIFTGDLCATHEQAAESAAKKELNLDKNPKPDVNVLLPQGQWYNGRQSSSWQNIRPPTHMIPMCPSEFSQNPQIPMLHYPQWNPSVQQGPGFPPMSMHHGNQGKQTQSKLFDSEPKPEVKNSMSFVPLQAQKKSRNATAKKATQEKKQSVEGNCQVQLKKEQKKELNDEQEATSKMSKVENTRKESSRVKKEPSAESILPQQSPKLQKPARPRRSRVAAKFGSQPLLNEGESQCKDSTRGGK